MRRWLISQVPKVALVALAAGVLGASVTSPAGAAIPVYPTPGLALVTAFNNNPFPGTNERPGDAEGLAYIPQDNSIWLTDDNSHRLYEIDPQTGLLKRIIPQSTIAAAPLYGGGPAAGTNTASDLEAAAYDAVNDVLYVFAGKCCTTSIRAAAFRLMRDANGQFQVESYQPFTSPMNDFSGVGAINGQLWTALRKDIYRFDYVTNTFSGGFQIPGITDGIVGMGFSPDGQDLWVTNSSDHLYRVNWPTRTLVTNHTFLMSDHGILDARAVEVVGDRLYMVDGYDAYASSSPDRYAMKVYELYDVNGNPPTSTTAASTTTTAATTTTSATSTTSGPTTTATSTTSSTTTTAAPTTTTTIPAGATATYTPVKDAMVNSTSPTKNYGTYDYMRLLKDASEYRPYVGFDVSGLSAPVTRAVLRFFVTDASNSGGSWSLVSSDWSESTLNWNNAPPLGSTIATIGTAPLGSWIEADVTSAVTGNGSYSFGAFTTSTSSLRVSSKEGANPPQLVITTSGDTTTTSTTSTTTTAPTSTTSSTTTTLASTTTSTSTTSTTSTTIPAGATVTFTAAKDAFVNTGSPAKNYGSYDYLRLLLSTSEYRSFVGFDVSGLASAVTRAVLRYRVTDASHSGGSWSLVSSSWSESTITWNNAPALGPVIATLGTAPLGEWMEVDVTSVVAGNGSYSFGGSTASSSSLRMSSKEGADPPQLVITTAG